VIEPFSMVNSKKTTLDQGRASMAPTRRWRTIVVQPSPGKMISVMKNSNTIDVLRRTNGPC
ncbi:hypothetical protein, partial [Escherichia coli]|uniref:hypothetical protein n=2 Tax=Enterobacteriaceae TaxID=543 RepID=UPI001BE4106E